MVNILHLLYHFFLCELRLYLTVKSEPIICLWRFVDVDEQMIREQTAKLTEHFVQVVDISQRVLTEQLTEQLENNTLTPEPRV